MTDQPTPFWRTVRLLLHAGQLRAVGGAAQQRELQQHRTGRRVRRVRISEVLAALLMGGSLHAVLAWDVCSLLKISALRELERDGGLAVPQTFLDTALTSDPTHAAERNRAIKEEAEWRRQILGGSPDRHIDQINAHLDRGIDGFVVAERPRSFDGLYSVPAPRALGSIVGTAFLLLTFLMIALQGEVSLEHGSAQRHPMWEWLLSHPVHPGAVFLAEMLLPLARNPFMAMQIVFWVLLLTPIHGVVAGSAAGVVIGASAAVAASCLGKAIQVVTLLRVAPLHRGAVLEGLTWLGFSLMLIAMVGLSQRWLFVWLVARIDGVTFGGSTPLFGWMVGLSPDGVPSLGRALLTWPIFSSLVVAGSVAVSAAATRNGLAGYAVDSAPAREEMGLRLRHRDPLWWKDLTWLRRDRGAIMQAFLLPLTLGASQVLRFNDLDELASQSWNVLSGVALLAGTYVLQVLGPRSLVSEGAALWIAMTWPHGIEEILKKKARLWALVSTVFVGLALLLAAWLFPDDGWKILLTAIAWIVVAEAASRKAVTLSSAPSEAGEPTRAPSFGRTAAAMSGNMALVIGVFSRNWHLALLGIAFSWLSAAAMWETFRYRLPFLFDPWSEKEPPAPALMHGVVAITFAIEGMALLSLLLVLVFGTDSLWLAQAVSYAAAAFVAGAVTSVMLEGRGAKDISIWDWPAAAGAADQSLLGRLAHAGHQLGDGALLAVAAIGGLALGGLADLYQWVVMQMPGMADAFQPMLDRLVSHPHERWWMLVAAVGFAPVAEEYLFRGLLYRALDREWGGWRAVLGSAVFFGLYHPPLAWVPVTLVGISCALTFKLTGRLWLSVCVHALYNAVVTLSL